MSVPRAGYSYRHRFQIRSGPEAMQMFPRSPWHNEAGHAARPHLCLPTPTTWLSPTPRAGLSTHQRQVHEHLHAVPGAHVSHVVEVGWVGYHFGSQFRVSEHLSAGRKHLRLRRHPQALTSPSFTAHSRGPMLTAAAGAALPREP